MAVIFIDGFDHYTDWLDKWDAMLLNSAITTPSPTPYGYGRSMKIIKGTLDSYISKQLINEAGAQSTDNTLVFGAQVRPSANGNSPHIMIFGNDSTQKFGVEIDGTNIIVKAGLTTVATLIGACAGSTFTFLEAKMEVNYSGTTDRITVRANGTQLGQWTGSWLTEPNWGHIRVINNSQSSTDDAYIDDLYVLDGSGPDNNDFLGISRVVVTGPNSIGPNNEFVATGGDTTVTAVDDTIAIRTDTNWVENGVLNSQQNYDQVNLSSLGLTLLQVYAVQTVNYVRKSDAQAVRYKNQLVADSIVYNGYEQLDPSTVFKCHAQIWDKYPADSSAWSEAKADLCGSGIKITYKDVT